MKKNDSTAFMFIMFAIVIIAAVLIWVVKSSFEASAYARVTGKNVSTWDAMWLDLRVQESPR